MCGMARWRPATSPPNLQARQPGQPSPSSLPPSPPTPLCAPPPSPPPCAQRSSPCAQQRPRGRRAWNAPAEQLAQERLIYVALCAGDAAAGRPALQAVAHLLHRGPHEEQLRGARWRGALHRAGPAAARLALLEHMLQPLGRARPGAALLLALLLLALSLAARLRRRAFSLRLARPVGAGAHAGAQLAQHPRLVQGAHRADLAHQRGIAPEAARQPLLLQHRTHAQVAPPAGVKGGRVRQLALGGARGAQPCLPASLRCHC
jgi:hypothetical protein